MGRPAPGLLVARREPYLCLWGCTEFRFMNDHVVSWPFNCQLLDPSLGVLLGGKALDGDEVVLVADVGIGMEGKVRWIGEGLLLVAHGRIDSVQGWQ